MNKKTEIIMMIILSIFANTAFASDAFKLESMTTKDILALAEETSIEMPEVKDIIPAGVTEEVKVPDVPVSKGDITTDLTAINPGWHIARYEIMQLEVHRTQQVIRRYLTENLGCSEVKLCMTNYTKAKHGWFSTTPGTFTLNLTAVCSAQFTDFKFDLDPADDWEDYSDVLIGYTQNSKWVERLILVRPVGEDFRRASSIQYISDCDSSPVDPNLPYRIITDPRYMRTFRF